MLKVTRSVSAYWLVPLPSSQGSSQHGPLQLFAFIFI